MHPLNTPLLPLSPKGTPCSLKPRYPKKRLPDVLFGAGTKFEDPNAEALRQTRLSIRSMLQKHFLRELNTRPRVHPNGFLQLDLTPRRRLHIWGHPDTPKRDKTAHVHDHVFGFRSWAILGRLINVVYDVVPGGKEFEIYEPRIIPGKEDDAVLQNTGIRCGIRPKWTQVIVPPEQSAGGDPVMLDYYDMKPGMLHETFVSEPTVTVIDKDGDTLGQRPDGPRPRVLIPAGQRIDAAFSRYAEDANKLWKIIEDVLKL